MKLPVDDILPELLDTLRDHSAAVVEAPPGAGKTTRIPPALLDLGPDHRVLVVEPRRIAARAAATRIADERRERVGDRVGYQVRFDNTSSDRTRLLVATEGILLRKLQADPFLEDLHVVVFDEFHERNLASDIALAMVRQVLELRDDLRVVVMSATLERDSIARYLDCPTLVSAGRRYPVTVTYAPRGEDRLEGAVARATRRALDETDGDILVFLPGKGEIQRCSDALTALARERSLDITPLHGSLRLDAQARAITAGPRRKVVLATNVAETSLTVEGVTAVVDSGLVRTMRLDLGCGLPRLELGRISQASAEQRAGRAGRLSPGLCIRLWSEAEHAALDAYETPEIQRVDLAGPVLQLLDWGERDLQAFPWFEPPEDERLRQAFEQLRHLGACTDDHLITPIGKKMARLPAHPRLARLLIEGHQRGHLERAALLAAWLSERDPLRGQRVPANPRFESDIEDRLRLLERGSATRSIRRVADQLERLTRRALDGSPRARISREHATNLALLAAFPDRVALRRERRSPRALMVGGRGVRLARESRVQGSELFICVDLDAGRRGQRAEAFVRKAAAIDREDLDEALIETRVELEFDADAERVQALERTRFLDLILEERVTSIPDPVAASAALAEAASDDPAAALDLSRVEGWLTRLRWLAAQMPELELPTYDDDALRALLPVLTSNKRSFDELRRAPLKGILSGSLTHSQRQALERYAPERLEVPSGSQIRLTYSEEEAPVLAVRIQEIFGWTETPKLARGRVPVLFHLLAPNMRPQQITDDLAGFWERTYPEVRKELRARYPKHAWPEDPLTAQAEWRPGRRRRR